MNLLEDINRREKDLELCSLSLRQPPPSSPLLLTSSPPLHSSAATIHPPGSLSKISHLSSLNKPHYNGHHKEHPLLL
ncbi:hypothetical protein NQZ68_039606 [Dissostichus eleginoides]|nr:hypothetical protein NQZ68_039606 [Dissostichus eleginoides]